MTEKQKKKTPGLDIKKKDADILDISHFVKLSSEYLEIKQD